jgi:hypothetical protein
MGASESKFKTEKEAVQQTVQEIWLKSKGMGNTCEMFIPILESQLKKHLRIELLDMRDAIYMIPNKDSVDINGKHKNKQEICKDISDHYKRTLNLVQLICSVYNIENKHELDDYLGLERIANMKNIAEICLSKAALASRSIRLSICLNYRQYETTTRDSKLIDISSLAGLTTFIESLDQGRQQDFLDSLKNLLSDHSKPFCSSSFKVQNCKYKPFGIISNSNPNPYQMEIHALNPMFSDALCPSSERYVVEVQKTSPKWGELKRLYNKLHSDYATSLQTINKLLQEILTNKGTLRSRIVTITDKELDKLEHRAKEIIMNFYFTSLQNYYNLLDLAVEESEQSKARELKMLKVAKR